VSWNYTTFLNIAFLLLAAALLIRFARTGGPAMLRMMNDSPETGHSDHEHGHHQEHSDGSHDHDHDHDTHRGSHH
jgi:ABC-type Zn2+ transport system substrate-binding protein/surface adhesin